MADEKRVSRILAKIAGYTQEIENDSELARLALHGELMPYDPVWHPRVGRWAHAQELEELVPWFVKAKENLEKKLAAEEEEAGREAERLTKLGFVGRLLEKLKGK